MNENENEKYKNDINDVELDYIYSPSELQNIIWRIDILEDNKKNNNILNDEEVNKLLLKKILYEKLKNDKIKRSRK